MCRLLLQCAFRKKTHITPDFERKFNMAATKMRRIMERCERV
jgi:hypothetical protein